MANKIKVKAHLRKGKRVRQTLRRNRKKIALGLAGGLGIGALVLAAKKKKLTSAAKNLNVSTPRSVPTAATIAKPKVDAALSLVVPASLAKNLTPDTVLDGKQVKDILDNTSYWTNASPKNIDSIEKNLKFDTDEKLQASEVFSTYLRLDTVDGEDLITGAKRTRYGLKESINDDSKFVVRQVSLLKSLNGLENFQRA